MSSRYVEQKPLSPRRLRAFVGLDNITAQMPLIEIIQGRNNHERVRIWTAYDYKRMHGTYTAVHRNGRVSTVTVYPSGKREEKVNRPADRK